jgi:hypothetical protein
MMERDLQRRRRILLSMLTTLAFWHPAGEEPRVGPPPARAAGRLAWHRAHRGRHEPSRL